VLINVVFVNYKKIHFRNLEILEKQKTRVN